MLDNFSPFCGSYDSFHIRREMIFIASTKGREMIFIASTKGGEMIFIRREMIFIASTMGLYPCFEG
jgi:hypothetical protein